MKISDKSWVIRLTLLAAMSLAVVFISPNRARANTTITQPVHWTKAQSPVIVSDFLVLNVGGDVTVDPGVVVQFSPGGGIYTGGGELDAQGTVAEPIIFTSMTDDNTLSWLGLRLHNSNDKIVNAEVRFGSDCVDIADQAPQVAHTKISHCDSGIQINGSTLVTIDSNEITQNNIGVLHQGSNATFTHNKIDNNALGIQINNYGTVSFQNNEIANNTSDGILINFNPGASLVTFTNNNIFGNAPWAVDNGSPNGDLNAVNNWWGDASGPHHDPNNLSGLGNPVTDHVIFNSWLTSPANISGNPPPPPSGKTPVVIIPGIFGSALSNQQWIIDPILHTYDNLIDTFKANGYTDGLDLFAFGYNWRDSNVTTALILEAKIAQIKHICNCSKVDIIAHSMGGLVARQYIQSNRYNDDVDHLIFLGTPQQGAPKAYLGWEGAQLDSSISDRAMVRMLSFEAKQQGYQSLFDYIRNKPIESIRELLPIKDYLKDDSDNLKSYPNGYPINDFLQQLDDNFLNLLNHSINITNIVGNIGSTTIDFIKVTPSQSTIWPDGQPTSLIRGVGDATVPLSNTVVPTIFPIVLNSPHSQLPTDAEAIIYSKLNNGNMPGILITDHNTKNYKILITKLLSPVDMQIIAPDGKKIGKDFSTNEEINEIPDAFYSGFDTDDEYITILNPLDGEYKIITQGTGSGGEYTVATALLSDTQDLEQEFVSQTTPGQMQTLDVNLSAAEDTIMITLEDTTPPQIIISSPVQKDYLRSEKLTISFAASDTDSGVFSTIAKLDTINVTNNQTIDLFFQSLGNHNFRVEAEDNAHNQSSSDIPFRVIATPESTISDINRAFDLGWIAKKSVKDDLLAKLNKTIKLETKIDYLETQVPGKPKVVKRIERIVKRIDKVLAKALLKDIENQKNKNLNVNAYNLLSEDINWLINN